MDYIIRPASNNDADAVYNLLHSEGMQYYLSVMPDESRDLFKEKFYNVNSNILKFVAEEVSSGKNIIGYAELTVGELRLRNRAYLFMIVNPDNQRSGVGSKLYDVIIDVADNWLKLVRIEFSVYTDNFNAIEFFERRGFEKEALKQKSVIRNGQYIDEFIMAKVELD